MVIQALVEPHSASAHMSIDISKHKAFSSNKPFTTEPKTRRIIWHRQTTVKTRATALQESFYPTTDVLYCAVQQRMASLLGIVDRASVLAYLGRPRHEVITPMDQTVQYLGSGTVVKKRHNIRRRLAARKGYVESFGLGYLYVRKGEWFVHWNHTEQMRLQDLATAVSKEIGTEEAFFKQHGPVLDLYDVKSVILTKEAQIDGELTRKDLNGESPREAWNVPISQQNDESCKQSIVDFSLSSMAAKQPTAADDSEQANVETKTEEKERRILYVREKFSSPTQESESNRGIIGHDQCSLTPLEKAIFRSRIRDPGG